VYAANAVSRLIAVITVRLKDIANAIVRHRNDIKQRKKERKSDVSWKRNVDGEGIGSLKTEKN
jgi:hypothetical protein